jgi:hypothetical protein
MPVEMLDWFRVIMKLLVWSALVAAGAWFAFLTEGQTPIPFVPRVLLCLLLLAGLWMAVAPVRRAAAAMTAQRLTFLFQATTGLLIMSMTEGLGSWLRPQKQFGGIASELVT